MKAWVPAVVIVGIVACAGAAVAAGLDVTTIVILIAIVVVGVAAIAGTRKMGHVEPGSCTECSGLISPNAPYCKHCGAPIKRPATSTRSGS
jgi:hypothetical protein